MKIVDFRDIIHKNDIAMFYYKYVLTSQFSSRDTFLSIYNIEKFASNFITRRMKQFHILFLFIVLEVAYIKAPDKDDLQVLSDFDKAENKSDTSPTTPHADDAESEPNQSSLIRQQSENGSSKTSSKLSSRSGSTKSFNLLNSGNSFRASSGEGNIESPKKNNDDLRNLELDIETFNSEEHARDEVKSHKRIKKLQSKKSFRVPDIIPPTGSMTPYKYFVDGIPPFDYPGCEPIRVWTLFRHSIRYPGAETIYGMRTRLKNFQEALILKHYELEKYHIQKNTPYDFQKLKEWKLDDEIAGSSDFLRLDDKELNKRPAKLKNGEKEKKGTGTITEQKALTEQGKNEMFQLGKRFLGKFGKIVGETHSEKVIFKFTKSERTEESARQFFTGVYGKPPPKNGWYIPFPDKDDKDPILKFDSICEYWRQNYKKGDLNKDILDSFTYGGVIGDTIEKLREDLDFPPKSFTLSDAKLLYEVCAFEQSWGKEDTPWCEIFRPEYQKVFEYLEDLELFNNDGPRNLLNKEIACILFQDMVARLIGKVEKPGDEIIWDLDAEGTVNAAFYFSHLTAILKFITHLGLFDNHEKLTPYNFDKMDKREWKSSRIGSFGTNISFVLMNCKHDGHYILTLHQERPVRLPNCPSGVDLCPLAQFLRNYENSIFNCKYKEYCTSKNLYQSQIEEVLAN